MKLIVQYASASDLVALENLDRTDDLMTYADLFATHQCKKSFIRVVYNAAKIPLAYAMIRFRHREIAISQITTAKPHRRIGLASRLIRDVKDRTRLNRISVCVSEGDDRAMASFQANQFRIIQKKSHLGLWYFRMVWSRHTPPLECYESRYGL